MTSLNALFTPELLFAYLNASSPNSLDGEIRVQSECPVDRKRLSDESISDKKPKTAKKEVTRPHERYGDYDPNRYHPEMRPGKYIEGEKKAYWYFILKLLTDPTKKDMISWTGRGYEFVCVSQNGLKELWRIEQEKEKECQWDSLRRNFRSCYKRRIMIPVNARRHIFAFIIEASSHIGWTKQQLADYIKENQLPLCTCSSSQSPFSSPHYRYEHDPKPPLFTPSSARSNIRQNLTPIPFPSMDSTPSPVSSPVSPLPLSFSIARILGL